MPPTWITSSFKGVTCHFQVNLYVVNKVQDLFWGVEVGIDTAYYESYVDISDLLMLVVCLKYEEYGCHPTELRTKRSLRHFSPKCSAMRASPHYCMVILHHHGPPKSLLSESQGPLLALMTTTAMYTI